MASADSEVEAERRRLQLRMPLWCISPCGAVASSFGILAIYIPHSVMQRNSQCVNGGECVPGCASGFATLCAINCSEKCCILSGHVDRNFFSTLSRFFSVLVKQLMKFFWPQLILTRGKIFKLNVFIILYCSFTSR